MSTDIELRRSGGPPANDISTTDARGGRPGEDTSFATLRDNVIEAMRIIALRRWTFFIPFCLFTCTLAISSHWLKRTYRATTVIERRDHPVLMNLRQTAATGEFSRFFRPTLSRDVRSIDALQEVVLNLGLVDDVEYTPEGELTEASHRKVRSKAATLISGVSAQVVQKNDHFDEIRIAYEGNQPGMPKKIVDQVKDVYVKQTRERLADMLKEGMGYFQSEADKRREEIAQLEEETLRFEAEYLGVDPTNPGALKLKLTSLEAEEQELTREIASLTMELAGRQNLVKLHEARLEIEKQQRRDEAQRIADGSGVPAYRSEASREIEKEISRLQDEIHDMQLTRGMTERHPDIVDRRERIGKLREDLKTQYLADAREKAARDGGEVDEDAIAAAADYSASLDMELVKLRMGEQDYAGRLAAAETRLRTVQNDITRHEKLKQNVFRYRKDYQLKTDQLDQARKDYALNLRRVNEIESILNADESQRGMSFIVRSPASGGVKPVRPKGITILFCAILAGVAAGAIGVLIREVFDQTYHTAKQVTRSLGIAVLESVDEIVTSVDRAKRFRRKVIYAPAGITVLLIIVAVCCGSAYFAVEDPRGYERLTHGPRQMLEKFGFGPSSAQAAEPAAPDVDDDDVDLDEGLGGSSEVADARTPKKAPKVQAPNASPDNG